MTVRRTLGAAAVLALLTAATRLAAAPPEPLPPVPQPVLEKLEASVQEQLRSERAFFDEVLARPDVDPQTLGRAYGAMGQLYYIYDQLPAAEVCFSNARRLLPEDHRWPYYLGVLYEFDGDLEKALDNMQTAHSLAPGDIASLLRLGLLQLETGQPEAAEASFRAALELDPESGAARFGLGRVAWERGDAETAVGQFERALELQPEADSIHHSLGLAYRRLGDLEKAKHHLTLNRHTPVEIPDPLMEQLATLLRSARLHFEAGAEALREGDVEAALGHLARAREVDESDALVRHYLGLALLASGAEAEATEEFRRAVELDPDYSYSHFNLASLLAKQGRYEEAARHYGEAHRLDPEDRVSHLEWATALSKTGQGQRAMEELEALLTAEPGFAAARLNLGALQALQGRWEEARANLERVVGDGAEEAAVQAEAHRQLAALAERRGQADETLRSYRAALALEPDSAATRHALALALARAGRYGEAADEFAALLAAAPAELPLHFGRSMALLLAGDHAAARRAIEEARARLPDEIRLTHLLARFLATCPDAALRDGARALELAQAVFAREESLEHAETVAMALAELGRFDEAARWQGQIVTEAERQGQPALVERARRRLAAYEAGRPVRSPWAGGG